MEFKTVEEVDKKLEEIIKAVTDTKGLIKFLESCTNWQERGQYLDEHVVKHLADYGLKRVDWGLGYEDLILGDVVPAGFLRDRFFYEMQQRTKMDFGFCPYFIPAYRERAKYFIEGEKGNPRKNWDKCTLDGKEIDSNCSGNRYECVNMKEKK